MSIIEKILGFCLIFLSIAVVAVVLFQEGQERSTGAITGAGSDTFLSNHKSRSIDAFLKRWTAIIAICFFVAVIAVNMIKYFNVV